jgi:hypothetical protein
MNDAAVIEDQRRHAEVPIRLERRVAQISSRAVAGTTEFDSLRRLCEIAKMGRDPSARVDIRIPNIPSCAEFESPLA